MTSIKKVVAIVLAFLMIFSSASVLASAKVATAFDSDKTALSIETKFFLNDEPVERVKPGDEVKARVYVGTDYYSNDSTLLFFYDKDFFVLDEEYTTGAAVVSNNSGVKGIINPNPDLSSQAYLTADYLEQYGAVLINLEVASINNVMYDASDWLFEIAFTVKDTAGSAADDITGDLFVNPATIQNTTEEGFDAVVTVPKGPSDGTDADLWPMFLWDADVTLNSTPVTSESTVTFNANGGAFETGDADSQSYTGTIETDAVPVQAQPVRSGYTFLGWDDASDETETAEAQPEKFQREDLVLNAVWVKNVNITFETDGGTEIPALLDKTPGTEFPAITDPTKPGYTFRGWDPALPEVYPTEDTTYNAIWKLNVTMTFDTLGGTEIAEQKGYAGQEFDPATIANPTKPGYSFRGWSPALPTAFPDEDTTYTAIYEEKLYSVEYYVVENGVATLKRVSRVEFNKEIPTDIINDLIPEGYALNGWYTDEACQTKLEDGKVMEGTTLKLYAKFEVQSYDAIFNAAGGYFDGDESKTEVPVNTVFDEPIIAPAAPVREGYVFKGWTPAVGVMDTVGGKTFYATWELDGENTVVYLWNNTDAPKTDYEVFNIAYTDSVDIPADPDLEGYTFRFWGATADATEEAVIPETMPAESLEFYAIWEVNKYNVTFDANGGYLYGDETNLKKTDNLAYKAAITAPGEEDVTKAGYAFAGWATTADATADDVVVPATSVPANDLTYYAVWTPAKATYTVEYYMQGLDGEYALDSSRTLEDVEGTTEGTVTAPALENITGMFTLNEGHADSELSAVLAGDGSTVLKAYYSRDRHTYTFTNTGDTTVTPINAYYGQTITVPGQPSWVGHTWIGWSAEIPGVMGTEDVEFKGNWDVNIYDVTFYANGGYLNGDKSLTEKKEPVEFEKEIPVPEAKRDGYEFAGWAASADSKVEVDVPETMGDEPDGLKFYAIWTANTNTAYKVEYHMQGLDSEYVLDNDRTFNGTGETDTKATAPELEGLEGMFTLNTEKSTLEANIDGDGTTVLEVYYSRDKHTYIFTDTGDNAIDPMELYYGAPVTEPVPTREGHDWAGWTPAVPETMGTTDMTFTGNWTKLTYKATFYANSKGSTDAYFGTPDEVKKEYDVYYGNPLTPTRPSRPGYIFRGWSTTDGGAAENLPATMPAEALVFYAVWEESDGIAYTVEYYLENTQGVYELDASKTRYDLEGKTGDPVTAPALENVDGMFYLTTHEDQLLESTIAGDGSTVLKAYYARNQYTFKAFVDGTEVESTIYYYDAIVSAPEKPAKVGYAWDNTWYSDATCETATTVPGKMPANDVTVYAKLVAQQVVVTIVVNYEDQINGGTQTVSVNTYRGTADSTIQIVDEMPANPAENTTYILVADLPDANSTLVNELTHYAYDAQANAGFNATNTKVNADGTTEINVYYAPVSYTIIYMNEGSQWDSKTLTYGAAYELPANEPKKDGYAFLGWYLGEDKAETTDVVLGDRTYTAKYENIDYTITYVYTFEGSTEVPAAIAATKPADVTGKHIGDSIDVTLPAAVAGYEFDGWVLPEGNTGVVGTSDVTVTGNWTAIDRLIDYEVTGDIPDGYTAPADVEGAHIGDVVKADEPDEVPGYEFSGWDIQGAVDGKVGTSDVTVTGSWSKIPYDVTYVYAGTAPEGYKAPSAITLTIGEKIEEPEVEIPAGYTLVWTSTDEDGIMGTEAVILTGTWAKIPYAVTYVYEGTIPEGYSDPEGITQTVGEEIKLPNVEIPAGYKLDWTMTDADGIMDAAPVTVTGTWSKLPVGVTYEYKGTVPSGYTAPPAISLTIGDKIEEPEVEIPAGYTLVWTSTDADGIMGTEPVLMTGTWAKIPYNVIYVYAGATPDGYTDPEAITQTIGETIKIPDVVIPAGYTLDWTMTDADGIMDAADVTVTGTWAKIPYNVTYVYEGDIPEELKDKVPEAITQTVGETIIIPGVTAPAGYTLNWTMTDADGVMDAADVIVTGTWSYIPYTITYVYAGDVPQGAEPHAVVNAHIGVTVEKPVIDKVPGYTVSEWVLEGDVDGKVGAGNVTATATWTHNTYSVTYTFTGDVPENANKPADKVNTAYYGDPIDLTEPDEIEGFTFGGWNVEGAAADNTVAEADVTVTGNWTRNTHKVIFEENGGTLVTDGTYSYGATINAPEVTTRPGYTFKYWYETDENTEFDFANSSMPDRDVTLTAKWEANGHTITFNSNGGSEVKQISSSFGTKVEAPAAPTRDGYTFAYWYETDETAEFVFPYVMEDRNVVLTAKWNVIPVTIDYKFTGNYPASVTEPADVIAKIGDTVDVSDNYDVYGYTFEGWKSVEGAVDNGDGTYTVGTNTKITVTGNWVINQYTVTFDSKGGTAVAPVTQDYNTIVNEPFPAPTKTGHNFDKWVIAGTEEEYDFSAKLVDNVALEATWTPILYTITFNSNGGTAVDKIEAYYEADISAKLPLDENMVKAGYTFGGWLKNGVAYELPATMPAESFRLDANWIAAGDTAYTVNIYLMDTTGAYGSEPSNTVPGSGTTGELATYDAPATLEGFTLDEAKSVLSKTIAADGTTVLEAYYKRNVHTVTFSNTYDATYVGDSAGTYYYEMMITAPSNEPVREGHSFGGWYTDINDETTKLVAGETKVPDGNVTYIAKWNVNTYNVTYFADGVQVDKDTFDYGEEVTETDVVPTKTGYTFSHWYETDEAVEFVFGEEMPARNIVLNAAWTANDVAVTYVFEGDVPAEAVKPADKADVHINDVIDVTTPEEVYGFTFHGWTVEGADKNEKGEYVVDTRAVTVTGNWTRNDYTITFNSKGGSPVGDITKPYMTVVDEPADPTMTGYTFDKWVIAGTTTEYDFTAPLTADVALEAKWNPNTYTITYVTGEGATQIPAKDYVYGTNTAAPSDPSMLGYTFSHWYEGEDSAVKFEFGKAMPARNITLNAAWTANNVSITYTFTGNVPATAVKPADKADAHIGDVINVDEPAAVAGYTFNGWTVNGADKNEKGEYVVDTRAVTVTGNWTINSYTIKFTDYNGTVLTEGTFTYDTVIAIKPATDPSREGYTFLGYYATIDGEKVKFEDGAKVPATDATYVAEYDINSYDLVFTAGETELVNEKVEYGKDLASYIPDASTVPAKEGYRFAGWALASAPATAVAVAEKMPANALSYVAVYESSVYNVYYYVKVVDGDDATTDTFKLVSTSRVEFGAVIGDSSNYAPAEGYEFNGWYKDEAMNNKLAADETMGNGKLYLYATETANTYNAVFDANGGKFADGETTATVPTIFEQAIVAPAAPTKVGYNFVGWTPVVGIMDTVGGKTFKAQWQAIEGAFTATYYVDGEVYEEYAIAAGDSLDVPQDPDKKGYEFLGWAPASVAEPTESDIVNLEGVVMPAENLEYNAVFKAVSADVTFYKFEDTDRGPAYNTDSIGYEVYNEKAYIFGDTFKILEAPALVNTAGQSIDAYYTFLHWVDDEGNTYEAGEEIEMKGEINFYPVYERVTVKLVPVEGSTTMIERYVGGAEVIESYNDGYSVTADRYTADAGFDKWYIYGLETGLNNSNNALDNYIKVNGDGYYTVEYASIGTEIGTGMKITVYDNFDTSAPVEEFYIIIFGDVTGDGFIMTDDTGLIKLRTISNTWVDKEYLSRAADVTGDGYIMTDDTGFVKLAAVKSMKVNQITGIATSV